MNTPSTHCFVHWVRLGLVGLGAALLILSALAVEAAGTRYAKPTATGTGNCSSWDNACTLQTALTGSTSGDEIWVAVGTYSPTTGPDRNATFQLKTGVAVYGGFVATETVRTQRDWKTNVTTLSGDIGTIGTDTDNSYHVVTTSGTDSTAVLDGFTITKGYRTISGDGAGVYNVGGSPTLANLIITGNYVWSNGAGMYTLNGNPTLTNITFYSNTVPNGDGGGLYNFGGAPTLTDVTFDSNVGGGMRNVAGNATLSNVTFYNNRHFGGGGALGITNNCTPTLTNVTFYSNTTTGTAGGAIYILNASPTIRHATIYSNSVTTGAKSGGAIYAGGSSTVTVQNTIIWTASPNLIVKEVGSTTPFWLSDSVVQGGCPSGVTCANLITTNPNLGSFGNNGGNTQTIPLLAGSSAIDALATGTNGCGTTILTDQRGIARPQSIACDVGAYELVQIRLYLPLVLK